MAPYDKFSVIIDKNKYTLLLDKGKFADLRRGHDEDPGMIIRTDGKTFKKMLDAAKRNDKEELIRYFPKVDMPLKLQMRLISEGLLG